MRNWFYVHFCLFVNGMRKKTGFIWIHKLEMKLLCKDIKEICSYTTGVLEEKVHNFTEKNKLKTITRREEGSSWRFGLFFFSFPFSFWGLKTFAYCLKFYAFVLLSLCCLSHRVICDSDEGLDSSKGAFVQQAKQGTSMRHFLVTKDTHLVFYGNLHWHILFTVILSKPGHHSHQSSANCSLYSKPKTH